MNNFFGALSTIIFINIAMLNLIYFKISKKELFILISISQLVTLPIYILYRFISFIPINIIIMIYLYKKTNKSFSSISTPIISTLIAVISDYIVSFIRIFIIGMNFDVTFENNIAFIGCVLADCIIIFIISKLLGNFINKKLEIYKIQINRKFVFLIISALLLTLIIFYSNIILGSKDGFNTEIIKLNGILFFIYFILLLIITYTLLKNIIKELEFKNKKIQFENLKEYTSNLEKLYTEMREFRHDYINILSSIIGYIENKDMCGLEVYFNNKIIPLGKGLETNNFKIGHLKNIKLLELKGILSSKLIHAQELGIDVFIDIMEEIKRIDMDIIDLCRVVGILIDNAIDAALISTNKSLKVAVVNKNSSTIIVIINSCPENTPPIYKLFQKGFSTKGQNRGLGLSNLKELISHYNNVSLDTIIENGEFIQKLEIGHV
ncbi:sensor histidine kinase [Clostridium weizhouense]|uniref:GHKL domain-containing protein n=1 Tax=Clostridium weizhouense TaxID=2859781 RepID=A0ABS7ASR6_9CLOT|nr:GHKL domain-containing protein [Clostridium weizhouense]MBW6411704.1 GHKL domain-containing protein [Clostridium weizhouense]